MPKPEGQARAVAIVQAAQTAVGVQFRPQGRGHSGLDCLGLVLVAANGVGFVPKLEAFPMRGTSLERARAILQELGCMRIGVDQAIPGDLLLRSPANRQVHLGVRTEAGIIEAHAALRRVVERPLGKDETWDSGWRLPIGDR